MIYWKTDPFNIHNTDDLLSWSTNFQNSWSKYFQKCSHKGSQEGRKLSCILLPVRILKECIRSLIYFHKTSVQPSNYLSRGFHSGPPTQKGPSLLAHKEIDNILSSQFHWWYWDSFALDWVQAQVLNISGIFQMYIYAMSFSC